MAHKTLINGTAYEIAGGRALIGGTGYDIKNGRTLAGGTGYDVSFGPANILELLERGTVVSASCSFGTSSLAVSMSISTLPTSGSCYLLVANQYGMSLFKCRDGVVTAVTPLTVAVSSNVFKYATVSIKSNFGTIYLSHGPTFIASDLGSNSATKYTAGSITAITFDGVDDDTVESFFAGLTKMNFKCGSGSATVGFTPIPSTGEIVIVSNANDSPNRTLGRLAISVSNGSALEAKLNYGASANPTLTCINNGGVYVSLDGINAANGNAIIASFSVT